MYSILFILFYLHGTYYLWKYFYETECKFCTMAWICDNCACEYLCSHAGICSCMHWVPPAHGGWSCVSVREDTMDSYCEPRMRNTEVVVKSSQSETFPVLLLLGFFICWLRCKKKKLVQYLEYFMIRLKPWRGIWKI